MDTAKGTNFELKLRHGGIGDCLIMSALIRDLKYTDPNFKMSVIGSASSELFLLDDRVSKSDNTFKQVFIDYAPTIDRSRSDKSARYIYAPHEAFERVTGIRVHRGVPKPELILDEQERYSGQLPYGVIASGTKQDIPLKAWVYENFRSVVLGLPELKWLQVGALFDSRKSHIQTAIPECINLLGKTSIRELINIIANAKLVICHVSLPMLIAAAFNVPCIAIAGGREEPWLFEGMDITYLHTIGQLDCCATRGCRRKVAKAPHNDSTFPEEWACSQPIQLNNKSVGKCMEMITPEHVIEQAKKLL